MHTIVILIKFETHGFMTDFTNCQKVLQIIISHLPEDSMIILNALFFVFFSETALKDKSLWNKEISLADTINQTFPFEYSQYPLCANVLDMPFRYT